MPEIKHEIKKHIGILSENSKGWKKEVNYVSWNERTPKVEIREWSEDYERVGKGLTFTNEEVERLRDIFGAIDVKKLVKA